MTKTIYQLLGIDYNEKIIAGVDEVGRGPLCGPVVAAAVIFKDKNKIPSDITDSKKISKKNREKLFPLIIENSYYAYSIIDIDIIDKINIYQSSLLAMRNATLDLSVVPDYVLVDGNALPNFNNIKAQAIVKGDSKIKEIGAASIIAKVIRDKIMTDLAQEFPQYKWEKNSGYATKDHLEAIKKYGPCKYHRKSFAPISQYFQKQEDLLF